MVVSDGLIDAGWDRLAAVDSTTAVLQVAVVVLVVVPDRSQLVLVRELVVVLLVVLVLRLVLVEEVCAYFPLPSASEAVVRP